MEREHLRMLKEAIEEIEDKIADLKAIVSLIEGWEEEEKMKEYKVKLQYTLNTPTPVSIVVTVTSDSKEAKEEVDDFVNALDTAIRRFLARKEAKLEAIEPEQWRRLLGCMAGWSIISWAKHKELEDSTCN